MSIPQLSRFLNLINLNDLSSFSVSRYSFVDINLEDERSPQTAVSSAISSKHGDISDPTTLTRRRRLKIGFLSIANVILIWSYVFKYIT